MVNTKNDFIKSLNLSVIIAITVLLLYTIYVLITSLINQKSGIILTKIDLEIILVLGFMISVFALASKEIEFPAKTGAVITFIICASLAYMYIPMFLIIKGTLLICLGAILVYKFPINCFIQFVE